MITLTITLAVVWAAAFIGLVVLSIFDDFDNRRSQLKKGLSIVAIVALTAAFVLSATRTGEPQLQRVELRGDWVCRRR